MLLNTCRSTAAVERWGSIVVLSASRPMRMVPPLTWADATEATVSMATTARVNGRTSRIDDLLVL